MCTRRDALLGPPSPEGQGGGKGIVRTCQPSSTIIDMRATITVGSSVTWCLRTWRRAVDGKASQCRE